MQITKKKKGPGLQVQTFSSAAENSKQSQDFYCLEFQNLQALV